MLLSWDHSSLPQFFSRCFSTTATLIVLLAFESFSMFSCDTERLIAGSYKTQCFTSIFRLTVWNDFSVKGENRAVFCWELFSKTETLFHHWMTLWNTCNNNQNNTNHFHQFYSVQMDWQKLIQHSTRPFSLKHAKSIKVNDKIVAWTWIWFTSISCIIY